MTDLRFTRNQNEFFSGTEIITALYQLMLGRNPDQAGFNVHLKSLQDNGLGRVLSDFANSNEFRNRFGTRPGWLDLNRDPAMDVDVRVSSVDRDKLWAHVRRGWNHLGETEPYWSVLTNPKFRSEEIRRADSVESFYATGVDDVTYFDAFLERNSVALPADAVVVEFGCGVGRVTSALARRFSEVIALDVSASHLRVARERMIAENISNVEFVLLEDPSGLKKLKNVDVFFSIIVLQHNPPPIIAHCIEEACHGLRPGGIAFFQAPTYGRGYKFNTEKYLEVGYQKNEIEMHFIPQNEIFKIFRATNMALIETRQDHCIGHYDLWISNTFLARKES
jgi:SAM-dependent methyltransferase